jgi:hypothetical protein
VSKNLVVTCLLIVTLAALSPALAAQPREWLAGAAENELPWPPGMGDAGLADPFGLQGCPPYRIAAPTPSLPATPGEWHDPMDDTFGMSAVNGTTTLGGEIVLTQLVKRADIWSAVSAMVEGGDGKVYLGTSGARLKVYDPATGSVEDKGAPVPGECG